MTAMTDWGVANRTDAELATAAATGDRAAFATIYDRYAGRLHDFCIGMLRDRETAADCVQDTFCTAATQLPQLRDPDKLRPWLYSIARNEALRQLRSRRREQPFEEVPDMATRDASPDTLAVRTELADLIAEASGGLADRDRAVLELAYHHGLDGPELAEALGVSLAHAHTLVFRLRETIERALGALLVARRSQRGTTGCPELATILRGWDGKLTVLLRKRIGRHIEACATCEQARRRLVTPAALLGAGPVFIPAPPGLRARTLSRVQLTCASSPLGRPRTNAEPSSHRYRSTNSAPLSVVPQPPPHGRDAGAGQADRARFGTAAVVITGVFLAGATVYGLALAGPRYQPPGVDAAVVTSSMAESATARTDVGPATTVSTPSAAPSVDSGPAVASGPARQSAPRVQPHQTPALTGPAATVAPSMPAAVGMPAPFAVPAPIFVTAPIVVPAPEVPPPPMVAPEVIAKAPVMAPRLLPIAPAIPVAPPIPVVPALPKAPVAAPLVPRSTGVAPFPRRVAPTTTGDAPALPWMAPVP